MGKDTGMVQPDGKPRLAGFSLAIELPWLMDSNVSDNDVNFDVNLAGLMANLME